MRSNPNLHAVVDQLPHAVSAFEAVRDTDEIVDFVWVYANSAAAAITGYDEAALLGHTLLEVLPDHGPGGMLDVYRRVVESGEPYVNPAVWYEDEWGDGQRLRRAFDVRATKIDDGFVVITREVTEQMLVEERLRDLDAAKTALIAAIAHDFRTPLTGVVGYSSILSRRWDDMGDADRFDSIVRLHESALELELRIITVLDRIRVESGSLDVDLVQCNVGIEVRAAVERMPTALEGHRLVTDIPSGTTVLADTTSLARVLENLLSNAAKYSPSGSTITVRAEEADGAVVTTICDEGRGIASEDAEKVFEQFFRTPAGRESAPGAGVGLASVRQLVELMGGRIWVEPVEPHGSAFRFTLPRHVPTLRT